MRLDQHLVSIGAAQSRDRAKKLIKKSAVKVEGVVVTKPSFDVPEGVTAELLEQDIHYVSKGALKLKPWANSLALKDALVIDIGASTGGFTEVCLEEGAKKVYAVDVGTDQLHPRLKADDRVASFEKTDARDLSKGLFTDGMPAVLVSDVSFISIRKILPEVCTLIPEIKQMAVLVKPQFELQPRDIGTGGIVKSKNSRQRACDYVIDCVENLGFKIISISPVQDENYKANIEFMLIAER